MVSPGLYRLPYLDGPGIRRRPAPFHRMIANARWCVDFAMPEGTPVVAARAGIVVSRESRYGKNYANPRDGLGHANSLLIRHDDGQESFYAHLAWRSLRHPVGSRVSMGEVVAFSGSTGYATYPHLHFGVYNAKGRNIRIAWVTGTRP